MGMYQKYLNRAARISATLIILVGILAIAVQWIIHNDIMPRSAAPSQAIFIIVGLLCVLASWLILNSVQPAFEAVANNESVSSPSNSKFLTRKGLIAILGFSIAFAAAASYTITTIAGYPPSLLAKGIYYLQIFLNFSISGGTICLYALALWQLIQWSNTRENPELFDWKSEKIENLSNEYLQVFLVGVAIYFLAIRGVWVIAERLIKDSGVVRNYWIIPIAILVAMYFLLSQYSFHRKYSSIKQVRLEKLRYLQQEAFDRWNSNHNKEDADAVSFIGELIETIKREKTWPLDVAGILTIMIPIFIPAVGEFAQIFSLILVNR